MLCTASVPRQDISPDNKSLFQYLILAPCLLLVELNSGASGLEDDWMLEAVSGVRRSMVWLFKISLTYG